MPFKEVLFDPAFVSGFELKMTAEQRKVWEEFDREMKARYDAAQEELHQLVFGEPNAFR